MIKQFANILTPSSLRRINLKSITSPAALKLRTPSFSLYFAPYTQFSQMNNDENKVQSEEKGLGDIKINRFINSKKEFKEEASQNGEEVDQEMTPLFKIALLSIGACALFIYYKLNQMQSQLKKIDDVRVSHKGQAQIGENWELIDTDGNQLTPQHLHGKYYLAYFGFCHCPDICPANLIKIRNALSKIKETQEGKDLDIKVLFISVDPERDSPQIIRQFLDMYDPAFLGATGLQSDETKLKETLKSFKVVANKIFYEPDDAELQAMKEKYNGDESKIYTMDHTTNTFLMGTKGEFINFYDGNRPEEELAGQILKSILQNKLQLQNQGLNKSN